MRTGIALGLMLGLGSCSPPGAEIHAAMQGRDLIFTAREPGWLPFVHQKIDLRPGMVRVDRVGRIVWRIERKRDPRCLEAALPVFPLIYGKTPPCFTEVVRAEPLTPFTLYRIAAAGGHDTAEHGSGYFRTGMTVENTDEGAGKPADWAEVEWDYNAAATAPGNGVQPTDPPAPEPTPGNAQ